MKGICPDCKVARKNETDWNVDKFTLATLKLAKYLQSPSPHMNKLEVFNSMIKASQSKQLIFGEDHKAKAKAKYKVYKDLSIEIPLNFEEEVLDQFLSQLYFETELFGSAQRRMRG